MQVTLRVFEVTVFMLLILTPADSENPDPGKTLDSSKEHITLLLYIVPCIIGVVVLVFVILVICCYRYQKGATSCISTACLRWCGLGKYAQQVVSNPSLTPRSFPEQLRQNSTADDCEAVPFQFRRLQNCRRANTSTSTLVSRSTSIVTNSAEENEVFLPLDNGNLDTGISSSLSPINQKFILKLINEERQRARVRQTNSSSESGYGRSSADDGDTSAGEDSDGSYLSQMKMLKGPNANRRHGSPVNYPVEPFSFIGKVPDEANQQPMKVMKPHQPRGRAERLRNASEDPDEAKQLPMKCRSGSSGYDSKVRQMNNSGNQLATDDDGKELEAAVTKNTKLPAIHVPNVNAIAPYKSTREDPDEAKQLPMKLRSGSSRHDSNVRQRNNSGNQLASDDDGKVLEAAVTKDNIKPPATPVPNASGSRSMIGNPSSSPTTKIVPVADPRCCVSKESERPDKNICTSSAAVTAENVMKSDTDSHGKLDDVGASSSDENKSGNRATISSKGFAIFAENVTVYMPYSRSEINIDQVQDLQNGNRTNNYFYSRDCSHYLHHNQDNREITV